MQPQYNLFHTLIRAVYALVALIQYEVDCLVKPFQCPLEKRFNIYQYVYCSLSQDWKHNLQQTKMVLNTHNKISSIWCYDRNCIYNTIKV
jgi:hypothetical protein